MTIEQLIRQAVSQCDQYEFISRIADMMEDGEDGTFHFVSDRVQEECVNLVRDTADILNTF